MNTMPTWDSPQIIIHRRAGTEQIRWRYLFVNKNKLLHKRDPPLSFTAIHEIIVQNILYIRIIVYAFFDYMQIF